MGRAEKLRMHMVYHEGSCGKSHIFKGKKKKVLTRAWESQLGNVNQAHLKVQVARATYTFWKLNFLLSILQMEFLLWMETRMGGLMCATNHGILPNEAFFRLAAHSPTEIW